MIVHNFGFGRACQSGRLSISVLLALLASAESTAQTVITWTGGDIVTGDISPVGVASAVAAGVTLHIVTDSNHDFNARAVANNGTVNWSAGALRSGNGGRFTNNNIWNDTGGSVAMTNAYGGIGGTTFVNAASGTYNKLSGSTTFSVAFNNAGSVIVSGGTLSLAGGGTFADGSSIGSTGAGVVQLTGGTLTGSGPGGFTAGNFILTGGDVSGNTTFLGTTQWVGTAFNTAGTTTFAAGGTLTISGTGDHNFSSHTIISNGTVNWTGGRLRSGNGGRFTNNAIWNDSADGYAVNNDYGGVGGTTFTNVGTYTKTAGTTTFQDGTLVNQGTISVTGGTLNLNGGTLSNGSSIGSSGAGVVQLTTGTLTASGVIGAQNFRLNGGQLAGTQTFNGTLSWLAGSLSPSGTTTIGSTSTLTIAGAGDHDFSGRGIVNAGTVNWTGGRLRSGSGGSITNNATWNDSADGYAVNNDYGGVGGTTFTNAGTYNKTSGITTFQDGTLVNQGTINVTGGTLNLNGGVLSDGSIIGSFGDGLVQLTSALLTASGLIESRNLLLKGGQLGGTHTFNGTLSWLSGNWNTTGTTTFANTSTVTISGAGDHDFSGRAIVNNGTVNWTGGRLRSGSGGSVTNNVTWNDSADGYAVNNDFGGVGGTTFINAGTYNKSAGITTFQDGTLVNQGLVSVTGGVLNLTGGTLSHGSSIGSSGNGVAQLAGGLLTASGTIGVQNFLLNGGQLAGTQIFDGTLSWLAGNLNTSGTTTFANASTVTIAGAIDHDFTGRAIVNNGTVNWTGGRLRSGSGGSITNHATWNDSGSGTALNNDYGGVGGTTFTNSATGTYNKSGGTTAISVPLTNSGVINVASGTLALTGTLTNSGTLNVAHGAVFSSANALTFGENSRLQGGGGLTAPSLTFAGTISPGTLTTTDVLTITGDLSLSGTAKALFKLGGSVRGAGYDSLQVSGSIATGGLVEVSFINGFETTINSSMTFELVSGAAFSGNFSNVANGGSLLTTDGLGLFTANFGADSPFGAGKLVLSNFTAVPEPSTWVLMLMGSGLMSVAAWRRRRR